jgi:hypothetical protein
MSREVDPVGIASCVGENDLPDRFLTLLTFSGTAFLSCWISKKTSQNARSSSAIPSRCPAGDAEIA